MKNDAPNPELDAICAELEQADMLVDRMIERRIALVMEATRAGASVRDIARRIDRISSATVYYWLQKGRHDELSQEAQSASDRSARGTN